MHIWLVHPFYKDRCLFYVSVFCGKVYISYIKYASFKLGGVYDEPIKNKVAVITGVSRLDGIGAAICKELAESGYDIFLRIGRIMIKRCHGALRK